MPRLLIHHGQITADGDPLGHTSDMALTCAYAVTADVIEMTEGPRTLAATRPDTADKHRRTMCHSGNFSHRRYTTYFGRLMSTSIP